MSDLDLPLERYGLIAELAHRMTKRGFSLGKTALQKLLFFLQALYDVDTGYDFSLYTYGPFDSTLLSDLDSVAALNGVAVEYYGQQGYQISPGTQNAALRKYAAKFVAKHSKELDAVVGEFGNLWARSLELIATIVYVERDARASGKEATMDRLVEVVHELKPHFSVEEIKAAINALAEKKHIKLAADALPHIKRPPSRSALA